MSSSPALPVIVLQTARSGLLLDASEAERVADLLDDAVEASRPIDRARHSFVEILAQGVERGALDGPTMRLVGEHVVHAVELALPRLRLSMVRLFSLLGPHRNELLGTRMSGALRAWAPSWRTDTNHRWVFPPKAMAGFDEDLVATTRGWTQKTTQAVDSVLPHLDANGRLMLAASLRVSDGAPP